MKVEEAGISKRILEEAEERKKEKLAKDVEEDFLRRREARRELESGWLLNINFFSGNQYCDISPLGGVEEEDKRFYWQSRRVFNHIAPTVDTRIAKLERMKPLLKVRAFSDEEGDVKAAQLATGILKYAQERIGLQEELSKGLMWSETCGSVFYKVLWNEKGGVYRLCGDKVERICEYLPIGPCDTGKACRVAYCDELVVFDYYKQTDEGEEVCRLVVYADGKDGYFSEVYGSLGGNQYAYMQRNVYYFEKDCKEIQHAETPFFTSERLDFGTDKKKYLKTLTLKGKGSVTVGVRCGEAEKTYPLVFENGVAQARLQNSGKEFSFTFYLDGGCTIEGMQVEYVTGG